MCWIVLARSTEHFSHRSQIIHFCNLMELLSYGQTMLHPNMSLCSWGSFTWSQSIYFQFKQLPWHSLLSKRQSSTTSINKPFSILHRSTLLFHHPNNTAALKCCALLSHSIDTPFIPRAMGFGHRSGWLSIMRKLMKTSSNCCHFNIWKGKRNTDPF